MHDDSLEIIRELAENYFNYKDERISLIASENKSSQLLLSSYLLGLSDQYCSRLPSRKGIIDNLAFGNVEPLDNINYITKKTIEEVFKAEECDIRLLSGLNGFTVLLSSLLDEGDTMFKVHDMHGGHLSVKPIAKRLKINMHEMMLGQDYRLDMEDFYKQYNKLKPKVIFLDSSYSLFPYPVKEIKECIDDNTILVYDASHVMALIAGGQFQDPFVEGADIIHSTTHKTLWGPQKSMILFKEKSELADKVHDIVGNVLVSNTHLHHIFALLIAALEFKSFGAEYAKDLVENNKCFANCLHDLGVDVVAKEYGYTESNQFWVNCETKQNATEVFRKLQDINISANMIFLPGDRWGLRIGTNELTRMGATKDTFKNLAQIMSDAIFERTNNTSLRRRSSELKRTLSTCKYSFDNSKEGKQLIDMFINKNFNEFYGNRSKGFKIV
jgi:glycine hydroxymethyltransferase